MKYRALLALTAFAVLTSSPAQEDEDEIEAIDINEMPPVAEEACFQSAEIRDFDALSDEFVLVENRRGEVFLLTMFPGCRGLGSSIQIALVSDLNRVCSNSAARIQFRGTELVDTCPIVKIESVEDKESGERLAEIRSSGE